MKRNIIISGIFAAIFLLLLLTSCTCYMGDGSELRGCGYGCRECNADNKSCRMSCLDQLCPGFGIFEDYNKQNSFLGTLGVDYTSPSASFDVNRREVCLSFEIIADCDQSTAFSLTSEIFLFQGDTVVGSVEMKKTFYGKGRYEIKTACSLNKFYDPQNGEIVCAINSCNITFMER